MQNSVSHLIIQSLDAAPSEWCEWLKKIYSIKKLKYILHWLSKWSCFYYHG